VCRPGIDPGELASVRIGYLVVCFRPFHEGAASSLTKIYPAAQANRLSKLCVRDDCGYIRSTRLTTACHLTCLYMGRDLAAAVSWIKTPCTSIPVVALCPHRVDVAATGFPALVRGWSATIYADANRVSRLCCWMVRDEPIETGPRT